MFFALVVALGYIPVANAGAEHVEMTGMGEHKMLGLYMIGAADDVTHGLSALLFLIAAATSASVIVSRKKGSHPSGKCIRLPSASADSASSRRCSRAMVWSSRRVNRGPRKTSAPPTDPR